MKELLSAMVAGASYEELLQLQGELQNGWLHSAVEGRISQFENPMGVCPICERAVDEDADIVLHFGPQGLRKKARFCGQDCLEYFLAEMRQTHPEQEEE